MYQESVKLAQVESMSVVAWKWMPALINWKMCTPAPTSLLSCLTSRSNRSNGVMLLKSRDSTNQGHHLHMMCKRHVFQETSMKNFDPKRKLLVLAKKFWAPSKVFVVQSCHKHSSSPKICGWPCFLRHDSNSNVYVECWMMIMVMVLFLRLMVAWKEGRSSDLRRGYRRPPCIRGGSRPHGWLAQRQHNQVHPLRGRDISPPAQWVGLFPAHN